jgi:4-hydroxy-4-methyl-2-oxoglutarate aldolase
VESTQAESPLDRRWKYPALPFVIQKPGQRPTDEIVEALSRGYVPDIADVVGRMYTMSHIRSIFEPAIPVTGPATTVKCPPGDNLGVKKALTMTMPGDILVIDAQGFVEWCLGGFQMLSLAIKERGLKGLVVYGAYRDASEAKAATFPIYATALSPWSGPKIGPAEINVPVCCGGVVVHPGDIVSASGEGIVIIPQQHAERVAAVMAESAKKKATLPKDEHPLVAQDRAMDAYISEMYSRGLGVGPD